MTNIKDLAKYCNVSISTVSYALNDSPRISYETKQRIKQAAKDLHYIPNASARSLKCKHTSNIGVFIPGFEGTVHNLILSGIANVLTQSDSKYNMIVSLIDDKMNLIKQRTVDIAIVMDSRIKDAQLHRLSEIEPIITFDKYSLGDNIYNTNIDNTLGTYLETELLIKKGCKRIAFLLGSNASYHNQNRYIGYVKALKEYGIELDVNLVYDADAFTEIRGYEVIRDVIRNNDKLPFDAIVCANDELAMGAMVALKEQNYNIPYDCKVVGFDNINMGQYFKPAVTTVAVDWVGYGVKLAQLALDILAGKECEGFDMPVYIIERDSSK